jgi:hypothetical protein
MFSTKQEEYMVKLKEEDWCRLLKEYAGSGLTQNDFCLQKGIPVAPFKYRWRKEMEQKNRIEQSELPPFVAPPRFEEVSISGVDSFPKVSSALSVIKILLPNQIHCEFQIPISEPELGLLLKQLVALC